MLARHEAAHAPTVARPISSPLRPEALLNKSIEKEASAAASLPTERGPRGRGLAIKNLILIGQLYKGLKNNSPVLPLHSVFLTQWLLHLFSIIIHV